MLKTLPRQKIIRVWPWNWKSNIFSQLHIQAPKMLSRCKKIHKPGRNFSEFSRTFIELPGFKVQLTFVHGDSAMATLTSKSNILSEEVGIEAVTRLWHRCFLVNLVNFLRTPFLSTPETVVLYMYFSRSYLHLEKICWVLQRERCQLVFRRQGINVSSLSFIILRKALFWNTWLLSQSSREKQISCAKLLLTWY